MKKLPRAFLCAGLVTLSTAAFATTAHRNPPAVQNAGGLSKPLRLVALIPRGYPEATALASFLRAMPASQWLASVQRAYPAASPPHNAATTVLIVDGMPDLLAHDQTKAIFQDFTFTQARNAGIGRDRARQTIYVLYSPCAGDHGLDSDGCSSHHPVLDVNSLAPNGHLASELFTTGDSMAVILSPLATSLDVRTGATSHEVAEAYTNTPGVGRWGLRSAHGANPWLDVPPWVKDSGSVELMDLAAGSRWFEVDPLSRRSFAYQRIYSTFRSTHGFNDVDVPLQTNPSYNVTTPLGNFPNDWHLYTWPASISIPVTAWTTGALTSFKVTAKVDSAGGGPANPCTLAETSWTVKDGRTFQLRVAAAVVAPGSAPLWCIIRLRSTRPSVPADDDNSHDWRVGILVTSP